MNWTPTPPTKPGAYWFQNKDKIRTIGEVYLTIENKLVFLADGFVHTEMPTGEWCGPLVPTTEVEKAYQEAWMESKLSNNYPKAYADSRARRVVEEGEQL